MPPHSAPPNDGHPIQVAARKTGLSPEVLRVWEKRYGVVEPSRRSNGRRVYSDEDIGKLQLIRRALAGGRRIGEVAELSVAELEALVREDARDDSPQSGRTPIPNIETPDDVSPILDRCMQAILDLDGPALEACLRSAIVSLPGQQFVDEVVAPLFRDVGERWQEGTLAPYQEHLASSIIQTVLLEEIPPTPGPAPALVVATPAGQRHGLGAMLAAVTAALAGWRVVYLGADLPAADIAGAVERSRATAVALSIVFPADDPGMPGELEELGRSLPRGTIVLAGGRAAAAYAKALDRLGALVLPNTRSLRAALEAMRPAHA